jgi:ComF family protein
MDIFSYLRHCAFCHRSIFKKTDLFCENCWQKLFSQKRKFTAAIPVQNKNIYPLFIWSDKNEILETLLYSLKKGGHEDAHKRLAREFLIMYKNHFTQDNLVFVPVPSSVSNQKDHAHLLAETWAKQTNNSLESCLKWEQKPKSQKQSSKLARSGLKMSLQKPLNCFKKSKIIIVDDVVTTGSTILAASQALCTSKTKEIWCLAYRI